jgi:hypothetical protein
MKRAAILLFALAGCSSGAVVVDRPTTVSVPVTVPCVSGARPDVVASLKSQHPDWAGYTVKQKAELVAAQALRHKSYGEGLNGATGACS